MFRFIGFPDLTHKVLTVSANSISVFGPFGYIVYAVSVVTLSSEEGYPQVAHKGASGVVQKKLQQWCWDTGIQEQYCGTRVISRNASSEPMICVDAVFKDR